MKATDRTLPIRIDDPDQYLWGLGAVGGPDGLLDSLKDATEIRSVPGGGWVVDVDGAQVIFDDELVVMRIGVG
jgi:hypothetical protein